MKKSQTNTYLLSIGRHAAQFILRSAMLADPKSCHGFIASSQQHILNHHISHAALISKETSPTLDKANIDESDSHHMFKTWQQQSMICCGTFTYSPSLNMPDAKDLTALEATIHAQSNLQQSTALFHLFVSLNTKGCLETLAYQLKGNICTLIPLQLHEDGQQITRS